VLMCVVHSASQLAAMQRDYPEAMSCSYMSYLEEDDGDAAVVPSTGGVTASASNPRSGATLGCHIRTCSALFHLLPCSLQELLQKLDMIFRGMLSRRCCSCRITFLYKLVSGVADNSFGLNVARMARLPPSVLVRATKRAADMEAVVERPKRHEPAHSTLVTAQQTL